MKKVFLALAAVAAIAACSKSEVAYEPAGEISLAVVPQNMTKAMMTGETFRTSEQFNVWAWYKQLPASTEVADWMADETDNQLYIPEKPFEFRDGTNWGGETPYYWPNKQTLPTSAFEKLLWFIRLCTFTRIFPSYKTGRFPNGSAPCHFARTTYC